MNVLFLTANPNLVSTTRLLQSWLLLGHYHGIRGRVVVTQAGDFSRWLAAETVEHRVWAMPNPERRHPVRTLWTAGRVARWARRQQADVIHCNEHDLYPFGG